MALQESPVDSQFVAGADSVIMVERGACSMECGWTNMGRVAGV